MLLFLLFFSSLVCCEEFSGRFETCRVSEQLKSTPFCDTTLDMDKRVDDLLNRLETDEKYILVDTYTWETAVPRLGLSPFAWRQNLLHGLGSGVNFTSFKVTMFPQVINIGRTFNKDLWTSFGVALSDEARAMANHLSMDLSAWSPNINIFRDPRWGRGQETPGEDPYMTSEYGRIYTQSMQGSLTEEGESEETTYLKTIVTLKHYTCYDLEEYHFVERWEYNAIVSELDLEESYQPPFKTSIMEGKAAAVMCSYNAVNGVPMCANLELIGGEMRDEWGFQGFVVSDTHGVKHILWGHFYVDEPYKAAGVAMNAGVDLNSGPYYRDHLPEAVKKGFVNMSRVDQAVGRLLKARMMTGEFDPWEDQTYRKIPTSVISCEKHQEIALQLARESLVLLKNEKNTLPLKSNSSIKNIALVGPFGEATEDLLGNYDGPPPFIISPLEGLKKFVPDVTYVKGCDVDSIFSFLEFRKAIEAVEKADAVVMMMGLDQSQERESHDRDKLSWPGVQLDFIKKISEAAAKKNIPTILVVMGAGPIDLSWSKNSDQVQSIILSGYPGQSGGQALAELLFGEFSPSGRTTTTFYPEDYRKVSMFDMSFRPNPKTGYPGRTYRFYDGETIYEFGEGMSYTTFEYKWVDGDEAVMITRMKKNLKNSITLSCNVTNTGKVMSDVSILAFLSNKTAAAVVVNEDEPEPPIKELVGFEKLKDVKPGESRIINFDISIDQFVVYNFRGEKKVVKGEYVIKIGNIYKKIRLI